MRVLSFILIYFFLATSCSKEEIPEFQKDNNGVIISLPHQWKKTLHESGTFTSNSFIRDPIYYNNNIGIPTTNGGSNRFLTMTNTDNGETIWQWDDRYHKDTEYIDISYFHQFNNLLTYQTGGRSYCINLENGTTKWKFQREKSYDGRINPYENSYFTYSVITNKDGNEEQIAYKGDIQTGELVDFLHANLSSDYISPIGVGGIIYVSQIPNEQNILLITYAEPLPNWEVNSFFGLYNTQTKEWVWDRKLLSPPNVNTSVFTPPQIYDDKVYANVGKKLICHDLTTGDQIWSKQFTQDFMFSGFIIEEGKIIANNEDTYTYCLNPENGSIIWKEKSAGTSGRISYLNGIAYFVGGSTGKLHAIDVSTGKTVWKIDGKKLDGENFKTNAVYVLPAKNGNPAKVIALTFLNAYCFEAYQ